MTLQMKTMPPLARKITRAEALVVMALILVWLLVWAVMVHQREVHVQRMLTLQEDILALAAPSLTIQGKAANQRVWPLRAGIHYLFIQDDLITATSDQVLAAQGQAALSRALHGEELLIHLRRTPQGSDWFRGDKLSPRQWVSWRTDQQQTTLALVASEEVLLGLSGFSDFRLILLVCAGLASGLLLLALIWALSWLRISALAGLQGGD